MKKILKKKQIIITVAIILLIIGSVLIFLGQKKDTGNENVKIKYEDYTIYEGHKGSLEEYDPSMTVEGFKESEKAYYITGKISTKEDKEYTVITFNLYDEKDKLLGTAVAGLNELKKDEVYEFKALSIIEPEDLEKIDYYELQSVKLG